MADLVSLDDLLVFFSEPAEAELSDDYGVNNNKPGQRKKQILVQLRELQKDGVSIQFRPIHSPCEISVFLGLPIHSSSFLQFHATAYQRYLQLEQMGLADSGLWCDTNQGLVPAQAPPRDSMHLQRAGKSLQGQLSFYMQDQFTPITKDTLPTLLYDVAVIDSATQALKDERRTWVYALTTFPGHHATQETSGGYCFVNNAALACARLLSNKERFPRVGLIDVDYHAGNGSLSIFWDSPNVFFVSIHLHPDLEYPFNAGFADQRGPELGPASGTSLCIPLLPGSTWDGPRDGSSNYQDVKDGTEGGYSYRAALEQGIAATVAFGAKALVVSLGVDTIRGDPEVVPGCGMCLDQEDFGKMGTLFRNAGLPTLFVQEGGYNLRKEGGMSGCWVDEAVGQVLSCGAKDLHAERV